jgi:excinuclease ABC subunit B
MSRRDVIIVASVSAIYALGQPEGVGQGHPAARRGQAIRRETVMRHLVGIHYDRNDMDFKRGTFRARGDLLEIRPAYTRTPTASPSGATRSKRITQVEPLTGEVLDSPQEVKIFPAKHFVTPEDRIQKAMADIEVELEARLAELNAQNKLLRRSGWNSAPNTTWR